MYKKQKQYGGIQACLKTCIKKEKKKKDKDKERNENKRKNKKEDKQNSKKLFMFSFGRLSESLEEIYKAIQLNPLWAQVCNLNFKILN